MKIKNNLIKKNFTWNIIGTTFNSFNSLFFMVLVTRINGISDAGIFTFAFSTACLFYVIGVYSGRTYQVTDNSKISASTYLYSKIITCIIMIFCTMLFCIYRRYNLYKSIIIIFLSFYKMLEAFSESFYAMIQKHDKLYLVGKSLFFKAIVSLLSFFILDYFTNSLVISILAIIVSNLVFIIFYDFKIIKSFKFKLSKFRKEEVYKLLKEGLFTFLFSFLTLYIINAPKYSIDSLMKNSDQTVFGIIIMPATIIILFSQFIIQPFLVKFKDLNECSKSEFKKFTFKLVLGVTIIGILTVVIAYFIGIPLLEILYNIDLKAYLNSLIIIIIGAVFYGISVVFSTALTTLRKTFCQFVIYLITSIIAIFLSNYLIKHFGLYGAFYSYLIIMVVLLILYLITFLCKIKEEVKKNEKK